MSNTYPMLQKYLISDLPTAEELLPHLRRIDSNRWYSNFGPLATDYESKMRALIAAADPHPEYGDIHLTTMVTGYHALEVGLRMMKVGAGHKVLVPAVTFPACPLAAMYAGADAILADVDAATWMLTPEIARNVVARQKIDAVMPVAVYGVPVAVDGWDDFTRDTGIPVIIDAAAAIETQAIPKHGLVAHSLHATKPCGVGEGGLLVARDPQIILDTRIYSNFGTFDRIAKVEGSNTKMSEYHAAVGLQQIERWAGIKKKRRALYQLYVKHLMPLMPAFSFQPDIEKAVVSTLMLKLRKPIAAKIIMQGSLESIAFHKMYLPPLYRHPRFVDTAVANVDGVVLSGGTDVKQKAAHMTSSEMMFDHIVGVPFHPFMEERDVERVVAALTFSV
jgi:dTDP-4-amino-4,6-dideoxygalactose transaminase